MVIIFPMGKIKRKTGTNFLKESMYLKKNRRYFRG